LLHFVQGLIAMLELRLERSELAQTRRQLIQTLVQRRRRRLSGARSCIGTGHGVLPAPTPNAVEALFHLDDFASERHTRFSRCRLRAMNIASHGAIKDREAARVIQDIAASAR
jgi:hypothetical protein